MWRIRRNGDSETAATLATALERLAELKRRDPLDYVWARGDFYDVVARATDAAEIGFVVCPTTEVETEESRAPAMRGRVSARSRPRPPRCAAAKRARAASTMACANDRGRRAPCGGVPVPRGCGRSRSRARARCGSQRPGARELVPP